ncbi:M4 family metallopeptidase [Streptomyces sp. NPDC050504]|uniref:M4 family metallopeptidase n=1 Tax=Streptomyces sp. NPDC050504 TaxID=3365618 RepID=UPI00378833C1
MLAGALAVIAAAGATTVQSGPAVAEPPPSVEPVEGALPFPVSPREHAKLLKDAADTVGATAQALRLGAKEVLHVAGVTKDRDGTLHVRYNRRYKGLPVLGGDLVVHRSPKGVLTDTRPVGVGPLDIPSTVPLVSAPQARRASGAKTSPSLVVWAAATKWALAWESVVEGTQEDGTPSERHIVTDATTGGRLHEYEAVRTGTGQGQYNGRVALGTNARLDRYEMNDLSRGGHRTYDMRNQSTGQGTLLTDDDDIWGNGLPGNRQTAAVDAHYGAATSWDYFKQRLGRRGIRGDGVGAYSRVHAGNNYRNAFWYNNCFCMTYGDGAGNVKPLTQLDVAAHEMTHGVTFATAGLQYAREAGALNEATSDIFGTAVEFYNNSSRDVPDYFLGELIDLNGNGTPLRYMHRPSTDGKSPDYWYPGIGDIDVHHSSGPANHFFYLLAEGSGRKTVNGIVYDSPTVDGRPVPGIGRVNAEYIWYRALTSYMTSTTDYAGARRATLRAAADLFGGQNTYAYRVVAATWDAVNVRV